MIDIIECNGLIITDIDIVNALKTVGLKEREMLLVFIVKLFLLEDL